MHRWHRTGSTLVLAILVSAVVLATPAGSAAGLNGCLLEKATTVCRAAGQIFRVIQESRSPSERYAVAWIASAPGATFETNPVDGTVSVANGEARNSLVRLQDGAIVAGNVGSHPGDLAAYNHRRSDVRWSADGGLVGILNHDKWETLSGKIFRIGWDGYAIGPFDLLAFSQEAGRRKLEQRPGTDPTDYAARVSIESLGNDGVIRTRVTMEQPGGGGRAYAFSMRLRIRDVSAVLQAGAIKLGRLKRIE